MHGGGDDENYWLMELSDRTHGKTTMRVLDHMIEDGLCEPLIVVTPTFYADVEGVEPTQEQIDAQWTQHGWDETWKHYAEREQPAHMGQLDGFWIGETEVTVGEWRSVMGSSPGSANALGDDWPVVEVSWTECAGFCERSGLSLPTEAQWEYAARGASGRLYPWGDTWDATVCRNRENGAPGKSIFPVGSFPGGVSWCGAQDMAGNVWEWCADWFGNYDGRGPQVNPVGPISGTGRVVRGGGWSNYAVNCRSTTRVTHPPGESRVYYGFRVVANTAVK